MRIFDPIDDEEFEDDDVGTELNWRDVVINWEPPETEKYSRLSKKPTTLLGTNCSKFMRKRANVAAGACGLSKDSWVRLVLAHAIHAELGDDIDELLKGSPTIYRYPSQRDDL